MNWAERKLSKSLALQPFPEGALPKTVCGRIEFVQRLMNYPVVDEDTGEVEYVQLISLSLAKRLLDGIDGMEPTAPAHPKGRSRR